MTTRTKEIAQFSEGAWVMDPLMRRISGGIEKEPVRGTVRFIPFAGEIIGTGSIGGSLVYRIKFGDCTNFIFASNAVCYQCHGASDSEHWELCPVRPESPWRTEEHIAGFAA